MSYEQQRLKKEQLLLRLQEKHDRYHYSKLLYMFPDNDITDYPFNDSHTIYSRASYEKQIELFNASATHNQLLFIGPNGSGKTVAGGYFLSVHLTGLYPSWWVGKKWTRRIKAWVAGVKVATVRDGIQVTLLGQRTDLGSGLIPRDCIGDISYKPNTDRAIESVLIKHASGGFSELHFKSYVEEVASYSSASDIDLIALDEEPPIEIDAECTARLFRTGGIKILTFTPDKGLSRTMLQLFPDGIVRHGEVGTGKYCVMLDMDDVPHYSDEWKRKFFNELPPFMREAKFFGRPAIGAGLVFPIYEGDITFPVTMKIPSIEWPRGYGMDPGRHQTAVVWGAYNEATDTWYIYDEYKRGIENAAVHAAAIQQRGKWIPGIVDKAAAYGSVLLETEKIIEVYINHGLDLMPSPAGKVIDANIAEMWDRFNSRRLLIAENCQMLLQEMRLYRYDDMGKIVDNRGKDGSHHDLIDAMRYLVCNGRYLVKMNPMFDIKKPMASKVGKSPVGGY